MPELQQVTMLPEEIRALFAEASVKFLPILGNPEDDNLTAMREVLMHLLLSIPYVKDGIVPLYNLISLIKPPVAYLTTWHSPFPVPARPSSGPARRPNTTFALQTWPPINLQNAPS